MLSDSKEDKCHWVGDKSRITERWEELSMAEEDHVLITPVGQPLPRCHQRTLLPQWASSTSQPRFMEMRYRLFTLCMRSCFLLRYQVSSSGLPPQLSFTCAVSHSQGPRRFMEDSHTLIAPFPNINGQGFFAVFDGHAGKHAAEWCGQHFHEVLIFLARHYISLPYAPTSIWRKYSKITPISLSPTSSIKHSTTSTRIYPSWLKIPMARCILGAQP